MHNKLIDKYLQANRLIPGACYIVEIQIGNSFRSFNRGCTRLVKISNLLSE